RRGPHTRPSKAQVAEQFELLADLLELDGADAFRLSAYRRAATRIRESAVPLGRGGLGKKARRRARLGPQTARKLWVELGVQSADDLRAAAEQGRLAEVQGLGPKTQEKVL